MKEIWDGVGMVIGVCGAIMLIFVLVGVAITVCIFFHKVWEFVNEPPMATIKGNVTITPNKDGEVYVGNCVFYEGIDISSPVKVVGKGKNKSRLTLKVRKKGGK